MDVSNKKAAVIFRALASIDAKARNREQGVIIRTQMIRKLLQNVDAPDMVDACLDALDGVPKK